MATSHVNPGEDNICLGFLENTAPWKLKSKFFPSKVGGAPAWLALEGIPRDSELFCPSCREPLTFLCQLYLPDSSKDYSFHRTLFVFACRDGACSGHNKSHGLRVFRCQLPRRNPYYPFAPPVEEKRYSKSPSARDYCQLCYQCGAPGEKLCSQCHVTTYCSRSHQQMHWRDGHRQRCSSEEGDQPNRRPVKNSFLFPEAEIILEALEEESDNEEEEDGEELCSEDLEREIAIAEEFREQVFNNAKAATSVPNNTAPQQEPKKPKGDGMHNLESLAMRDTKDKQFPVFRERTAKEPDQVVRYHRRGAPLYCSSHHQPGPCHITSCPHCHRPRQFEFQIMPHMLSHLKVDSVEGASLDWGVLLVYSCFCDYGKSYTEELIFKQDYWQES